MKIKEISSIYAIILGCIMIIFWIFLLGMNLVPELETEPIEMIIVIVNELITASFLILGGYGLRKNKLWGYPVFLISLGMVSYSMISNLGYSAQLGDVAQVILMAVIISLNFLFMAISVFKPEKFSSEGVEKAPS